MKLPTGCSSIQFFNAPPPPPPPPSKKHSQSRHFWYPQKINFQNCSLKKSNSSKNTFSKLLSLKTLTP